MPYSSTDERLEFDIIARFNKQPDDIPFNIILQATDFAR